MWRVTFDRSTVFVSGPKVEARRRLAACGDASPIWVRRRNAWATSLSAANRLVDQLEARRIAIIVENEDQAALDLSDTVPANVAATRRQEPLW